MAFTPVLKATGVRLTIERPEFADGYQDTRTVRAVYGILTDADTGKRYKITGKSCGLRCACDAYAVELP